MERKDCGASLLELLIALTLVALSISVVWPGLVGQVEAMKRREAEQAAVSRLSQARWSAILERRAIELDPQHLGDVEEGTLPGEADIWSVWIEGAVFLPSGICRIVEPELIGPDGSRRPLDVEAPCDTIAGEDLFG